MYKKPRVRTLMDSEHVKVSKGSESLLKSAAQFFPVFFHNSARKSAPRTLF